MSATGFSSFDATVEKTNHILREIEQAYGWPKDRRIQSYAALRIILHALRDRLTVQVTAQMAVHLPLLVRGIFYDGWNPSAVPAKMDREAFPGGYARSSVIPSTATSHGWSTPCCRLCASM